MTTVLGIIGIVSGVGQMVTGLAGDVGGGALCASGVGIPAGVAVVAGSTTLVVAGATEVAAGASLVYSSVSNLGRDADELNKAKEKAEEKKNEDKIGSEGILDGVDVEFTSPYDLQKTQPKTLSKKAMSRLVEDIRINGIKNPIKYVEYNGEKYIVDGHHRVLAAKELRIRSIPIQKVKLPYAGYKTIEDLLWVY